MAFITSRVLFRNSRIWLDGEMIFEREKLSSSDFFQTTYEYFQINYPKFFKMDNLCKTGFIAAEILLQEKNLSQKYLPEEIGIIFSNSHSSLDTDLRYQNSINPIPSPSLFVYTLPNILSGEISIRHQFKGETACFVFDIFDVAFQTEYINQLFEKKKVKCCLSGWADYYDGKAEAFFCLTEIKETDIYPAHNSFNIQKYYQGT